MTPRLYTGDNYRHLALILTPCIRIQTYTEVIFLISQIFQLSILLRKTSESLKVTLIKLNDDFSILTKRTNNFVHILFNIYFSFAQFCHHFNHPTLEIIQNQPINIHRLKLLKDYLIRLGIFTCDWMKIYSM